MSFNVDVDEADVAVLNQNLIKSKQLFDSINQSLVKIAEKSVHALSNIKPILHDVNKLNENKRQVEHGIELLSQVNESAATIHKYEDILGNKVEEVGLGRYINTLTQSRSLLKVIKPKFKQFSGLMVNFEIMIDKSEMKLQSYFVKLTDLPPLELTKDEARLTELGTVLQYFNSDHGNVNKMYVRQRSKNLVTHMEPFVAATKPVERAGQHPYEKGSNGINRFNNELIRAIKEEHDLCMRLGLNPSELMNPMTERVILDIYTHRVLQGFNEFYLSTQRIVQNDHLVLECVENLSHFQAFMENYGLVNKDFILNVSTFELKTLVLLKEYLRIIEARFASASQLTDSNIPEIIVELLSKVRRSSEFPTALMKLIANYKLGDWLLIKPPVKFISVYTSVIPNSGDEESPAYLLSLYFSDVIDLIMVNIEIGLKSEVGLKKSTQGFYLIKNLVMIETIINRLAQFFDILGQLGMERLNKLKNRFLKIFLDDWNYALYIIIRDMTSIATSNAAHGGVSSSGLSLGTMSSKEKEQIKELFKSFNESFEEALKNYEKYNILDNNLRAYLSNEIKKLIINAYFKLYDKYGKGDFTKNKAKYVKYDKVSFEKLLNDKLAG